MIDLHNAVGKVMQPHAPAGEATTVGVRTIRTSPTIAVVPRIRRVAALTEELLQFLSGLFGPVHLVPLLKGTVTLEELPNPMEDRRLALYRSSNREGQGGVVAVDCQGLGRFDLHDLVGRASSFRKLASRCAC